MLRQSSGVRLPENGKMSGLLRALFATVGAVMMAAPAWGQWHVDMYLGAPLMRSENIEVKSDKPNVAGLFGDLDDKGELAVGGRFGYWWAFDAPVDLGVFVDASATFAEFGNADFNFVPVSALFMARLRMLQGSEFPNGRLHPYIGGGPSVVWSELDLGLFDDDSVDFAFDLRAGLDFGLIDGLGVFGEYRYTYFEPDYSDELFGLSTSASVEFEAIAHQLNFGFSWDF